MHMANFDQFIQQQPLLRALFVTKQGAVVVGQKPNWPLYCFISFRVLSLFVHGQFGHYLVSFSNIFLIIWASLEIYSGVNLFRRLLGVFVLGNIFVSWFALHYFW